MSLQCPPQSLSSAWVCASPVVQLSPRRTTSSHPAVTVTVTRQWDTVDNQLIVASYKYSASEKENGINSLCVVHRACTVYSLIIVTTKCWIYLEHVLYLLLEYHRLQATWSSDSTSHRADIEVEDSVAW